MQIIYYIILRMNKQTKTIKIDKELNREEYLRLISLNSLSNQQYKLLSHYSEYKQIGKEEKKLVGAALGISRYHLNNLVSALKKKGYLILNENKTYSVWTKIPTDVSRVVIEFKTKMK